MNKYTVDYDKKEIILQYAGEKFNFDLNDGDIGDFWHSLKTKDGVEKDINFSQDDENEAPNLSVYGLKPNEDGRDGLLIDTSDEEYIKDFTQVGNPLNYFN